jgi:hypothetical protein
VDRHLQAPVRLYQNTRKHQRAGCVGKVFLVVGSGIQAFRRDVKFKLFMPVIRPGYLNERDRNNVEN